MLIQELSDTITGWQNSLVPSQKRRIHFYSIRNFIIYYEYLPNDTIKEKVLLLLNDYISEVRDNGFEFDATSSYELANRYLDRLSEYYAAYLGFKSFLRIRYVILIGIMSDALLYIMLKDEIKFYFPIASLVLLGFYFYKKIFFVNKNKAYGLFY